MDVPTDGESVLSFSKISVKVKGSYVMAAIGDPVVWRL